MYQYAEGWNKARVMEVIKARNNGQPAEMAGMCVYDDGGGNHCAVGCFIPDNHKALNHQGGVQGLLAQYPELVEFMPFADLAALSRLQHTHDSVSSIARLKLYQSPTPVYDAVEEFLDNYMIEPGQTQPVGHCRFKLEVVQIQKQMYEAELSAKYMDYVSTMMYKSMYKVPVMNYADPIPFPKKEKEKACNLPVPAEAA